jgi:hypothetical protein
MPFRRSLIVLGLAAALAACGGSSSSTSAPPPASSSAPAVASCEGVHLGQTGVISLQCNGTATVKATVGTLTKQISGPSGERGPIFSA